MGELTTKTDVAVIGGGPGGYTAAIRAAQLGLDVILIEKDKLGGCCTNVGCIPSKALIHIASLLYDVRNEQGIKMGFGPSIQFDFKKARAYQDGVVNEMRDGIAALCRLNGIEVINGQAFFTSSGRMSVQTEAGLRDIEFKKAIVATGTTINGLENLPFDHERVIDSDDVFSLANQPSSLLIVGGGYIAVEMAALFAKLGTKVTISYRGERLLKNMDADLSDAAHKGMKKLGVEVLFNSQITGVSGNEAQLATAEGERTLGFDKILVAAGRTPHFEGLGLEKTGARLGEDGLIVVDSSMKTTDDNIYAVGDVVFGPQLAHKAFRQGKIAAEAIAGQKSAYDNNAIPMVVFAEPELASVGLTAEEAAKQGHKVKVGKMPLTASGRAKSMGKKEGFVKVVADESGTILGVHIAGAEAATLIAEGALAVEMGARLEDIAATIHAHPTMPESVMEAAEDALGRAVHIYRGKKAGQ
ncbi:MAG: dihydrolipoyl dehydrogenase [Candidatus Micrarchaeota archaeon]